MPGTKKKGKGKSKKAITEEAAKQAAAIRLAQLTTLKSHYANECRLLLRPPIDSIAFAIQRAIAEEGGDLGRVHTIPYTFMK
jgi:hypothetical protein